MQITAKVSDGSSETWRTFNLTITPVNDPPAIQPSPDMGVALGEFPSAVPLTVSDVDNDPAALTVTATSSSTLLLPNSGLQVLPGPTPATRWLKITPTPDFAGDSTITATFSDGAISATDTFVLRVSHTLATNLLPVCFVNNGSSWRYWVQPLPMDSRTGQPINWTIPNVDERFWGSARTQLGFGSDGEVSVIPSTPLRITTYLRRHFTVFHPAAVTALKIRLLRDDGAAIYLNGTKVHTSNLPNSTLTESTLALTEINNAAEDA